MKWMLPDGVEEWLPPDAWRLETLRRQVLDTFHRHGFELILPPMLEYADSLNIGVGRDLMLQTFALTDQLSGRRLGLRADITPQAARIDAHRFDDPVAVRRLCYLGSVLRARPDLPGGPRSLRQLGAEIFGSPHLAADIEVISVMCAVLEQAGCTGFTLDIGHAGILRALLPSDLDEVRRDELVALIQMKAVSEVKSFALRCGLSAEASQALADVCLWHGEPERLPQSVEQVPEAVRTAFAELLELCQQLRERFPQQRLHLDCGELTGYHYQTGVTWAAYAPGQGQALARGGRYDGIGSAYGANRPATGFSADLNMLCGFDANEVEELVWAPVGQEPDLLAAIAKARQAGYRVRQAMPGEKLAGTTQLVQQAGEWTIEDQTS